MIISNNKMMEDVEAEVKYKAGLGSDVKFYDNGNRQILKGEYVFEHTIIWLKRVNERAEILECSLTEIILNAFVGEINVKTTIKCFDG
jgi:hypothetical protein